MVLSITNGTINTFHNKYTEKLTLSFDFSPTYMVKLTYLPKDKCGKFKLTFKKPFLCTVLWILSNSAFIFFKNHIAIFQKKNKIK